MSSATIDRLLAPVRQSSGGNGWRRAPRAHSGVRRRVPLLPEHHRQGREHALVFSGEASLNFLSRP